MLVFPPKKNTALANYEGCFLKRTPYMAEVGIFQRRPPATSVGHLKGESDISEACSPFTSDILDTEYIID